MSSGGNFLDDLLLGVKTIQSNGVVQPTEPTINFIGASIVDDPGNKRTNVTVSANPNAVSGTGFWHSTSGLLDGAAKLVNLSTDTIGILPLTDLAQSGAHTNDLLTWTGTQWAPVSTIGVAVTMAGEVTGTTATSVVSGPFSTSSLAWASTVTSAVLGTNRAGATLALKVDAGTTIATLASGSVTVANGNYLAFPDGSGHLASTGTIIRAMNGASIVARNSTNTLDAKLLEFDASNNLNIGQTAATGVGNIAIAGNSTTMYFGAGASYFDCGPLNFRGSAHTGALVLDVDTAPHAPTFISGASTTSFTVGTNASGATLALQADAAANVAQLAGGTQNGFALGSAPATVGHIRTPNSFTWMARNGANTTNANIVSFDSSNTLIFGDNSNAGAVRVWGGSSTGLQTAGAAYLLVNTSTYDFNGAITVTPNTATPSMLSEAFATSFTIGTNKSAASLVLQADAATTIQTLASTGTELANLSTPAAGTGPRLLGASGRFEVVDSDGTVRIF